MSDPIAPMAGGVPIAVEGPAQSARVEPVRSFEEVLQREPAAAAEEPGPAWQALTDAARSLARSDQRVQRGLRRARRGGMDPAELLALQSGVYRYAQEVELASKVVDKATGALKTTLQSQQ